MLANDVDVNPDAWEESAWTELPQPEVLPPHTMLEEFEVVNVLAPLVRCSKLPFRHLCSLYETHITHTPMTLAEEFSRSETARISDFTTSKEERGVFWMAPRTTKTQKTVLENDDEISSSSNAIASSSRVPHKTFHVPPPHIRLPPSPKPPTAAHRLVRGSLIAQFASPNASALADSAELISPYVDGMDINCGCPQSWAHSSGIGCALLRKPELVRDMVRGVKDRMGWGWPVSIKIRVDNDPKLTDLLIKTALQAQISHLTIHGRTRHQPSTHPVSLPSIKFAVECANGEVPCVANGDMWEYEDAEKMRTETGVHGVMGARGLLANPAVFAGYKVTPKHAVEQFVDLSVDYGFIFPLFHKHLGYMLESAFSRPDRVYFNSLAGYGSTIDFLDDRAYTFKRKLGSAGRIGRTLV